MPDIATLQHKFQSVNGFYGPNQYGMCHIFRSGHYIEQVVDAVTQVHIRPATFPEHYLGTRGSPVVPGMAGPVVGSAIGFCFGYDPRRALPVHFRHQYFTQKIAGNLHHIGTQIKFGR